MPYSVLMPIFADKILHGGARGLGILMGATGVGALAGSLALAAKNGHEGAREDNSLCLCGICRES